MTACLSFVFNQASKKAFLKQQQQKGAAKIDRVMFHADLFGFVLSPLYDIHGRLGVKTQLSIYLGWFLSQFWLELHFAISSQTPFLIKTRFVETLT